MKKILVGLLVIAVAGADRQHVALLGLFLGGFGEHNATRGDLFLFDGFDHNAIAEWFEFEF